MTAASGFLTDVHSRQQYYPEDSDLCAQSSKLHALRYQPAYSPLQLLSLLELSALQYQYYSVNRAYRQTLRLPR